MFRGVYIYGTVYGIPILRFVLNVSRSHLFSSNGKCQYLFLLFLGLDLLLHMYVYAKCLCRSKKCGHFFREWIIRSILESYHSTVRMVASSLYFVLYSHTLVCSSGRGRIVLFKGECREVIRFGTIQSVTKHLLFLLPAKYLNSACMSGVCKPHHLHKRRMEERSLRILSSRIRTLGAMKSTLRCKVMLCLLLCTLSFFFALSGSALVSGKEKRHNVFCRRFVYVHRQYNVGY